MVDVSTILREDNGLVASEGGWELVAVIAIASLMLAVGPGRLSVDGMIASRRASRVRKDDEEAAGSANTRSSAIA